MGGHSTSDDPTKYVPKELLDAWREKDPIERFERYLAGRGLWTEATRDEYTKEAQDQVNAAAREAESTPPPVLESIFTDVYADIPDHLRRQGQAAFDLARRKGDAAAGDGAFPL